MAAPGRLRLPLRIGVDGSFETIEQDTLDEVVQCVAVIAATPIGSRVELPLFGIPRAEFGKDVPLVAILTALYTWEPRAMALVRAAINGTDELERDLTIQVSM